MPTATGHIAQVVGPVVDVHFNLSAAQVEAELPRISDALQVTRPDGKTLILEVQQHIGTWERWGLRTAASCVQRREARRGLTEGKRRPV